MLGANKYITRSTTSLLIKLKHPKSSLRFDSKFFDNNNINRILIECPANNRAQIEVAANAFVGNKGPFPEIDVVNCFAIVLRSNAFQGTFFYSLGSNTQCELLCALAKRLVILETIKMIFICN